MTQELFSAGKAAKELDVAAKAVKEAIDKLKIEADVIKGNCKYYTRETLEKIKKGLNK